MIEIVEKKDTGRITNEMRIEFAAISDNESFARMAIAAFVTPLNPTLEGARFHRAKCGFQIHRS